MNPNTYEDYTVTGDQYVNKIVSLIQDNYGSTWSDYQAFAQDIASNNATLNTSFTFGNMNVFVTFIVVQLTDSLAILFASANNWGTPPQFFTLQLEFGDMGEYGIDNLLLARLYTPQGGEQDLTSVFTQLTDVHIQYIKHPLPQA